MKLWRKVRCWVLGHGMLTPEAWWSYIPEDAGEHGGQRVEHIALRCARCGQATERYSREGGQAWA